MKIAKRKPKNPEKKKEVEIKLDRTHPHSLQASQLRPGDVLLYCPKSPKPHQKIISEISKSPFSHAAIYVGKNLVAEATAKKIKKTLLPEAMKGCLYVGVLRSPIGFSADRVTRLVEFVDKLIAQNTKYDWLGALQYETSRDDYFTNQLDIIGDNIDKPKSAKQFLSKRFFCSALIVAAFCYVGIIGDSAQAAYPTDVYAPGDLHKDPTFGWFAGYLLPEGQSVPDDDPLIYLAHI